MEMPDTISVHNAMSFRQVWCVTIRILALSFFLSLLKIKPCPIVFTHVTVSLMSFMQMVCIN